MKSVSVVILVAGVVVAVVAGILWSKSFAQSDKAKSLPQTDTKATRDVIDHLNTLALEAFNNGNYKHAMGCAQQAEGTAAQIGFLKGSADSFNLIGRIYEKQANYSKALENHFKALQMREGMGDEQAVAGSYNNIGNCYMFRRENPQALEYYLKALQINEATGNKAWQAKNLTNIGIIYDDEKDYPRALEYYSKGLKLHQEMGNKQDVANSLNNIGFTYANQGNYAKALENYFGSLQIKKEINERSSMSETLNNIGNAYAKQAKYAEALDYCGKSLALAKEIGATDDIKEAQRALSEIYEARHEPGKALELYKTYIVTRDGIFNEENTRNTVRAEMNFEFDKKEAALKAEKEKQLALAGAARQKALIVAGLVSAGLILTLLFSFFITKERRKSERLLLNVLPKQAASELKRKNSVTPKRYEMVTVMFTDFKAFTAVAEKMEPEVLLTELNYIFKRFDNIVGEYPIEKIKTIGDSYMCAGGLPVENSTNAADVVTAALDIRDFARQYKERRMRDGKPCFELRIGVHTGPVVAGIVGEKKFAYDIWGDTVNTASRMESSCEEGKVNISGQTYRYLIAMNRRLPFRYVFRDKIATKNKAEIEMYFVERDAVLAAS
jgi:class 3 adenylate cyclase